LAEVGFIHTLWNGGSVDCGWVVPFVFGEVFLHYLAFRLWFKKHSALPYPLYPNN